MLATVKEIDESDFTCTLEDEDGLKITQVRLRPVIDSKEAITIFPKIGTWALAVRIESDNEWMLIASGEADKWRIKTGAGVMEQSTKGLLIQHDSDTLLQVIELLVQACMKIVVLQGQNPDYPKLQEALSKAKKILQ
ncbi:hypothetical protein FLA_5447 [Filimonas lacunae]|nr:hypothetical protein FLA_5447 [Filimonas lacunae]